MAIEPTTERYELTDVMPPLADDELVSMVEAWDPIWRPYYTGCSLRAYHTDKHIDDMVQLLREYPGEVTAAHVYAVLFHDAVYIPTRDYNEKASADLAYALARQPNTPRIYLAAVLTAVEYILCTANHHPTTPDAAIVVDVDLAATLVGDYVAGVQQIRREYSSVSDEAWIRGRLTFVTQMLEKDQLFYTSYFADRYEAHYKFNLRTELDALQRRAQRIT